MCNFLSTIIVKTLSNSVLQVESEVLSTVHLSPALVFQASCPVEVAIGLPTMRINAHYLRVAGHTPVRSSSAAGRSCGHQRVEHKATHTVVAFDV